MSYRDYRNIMTYTFHYHADGIRLNTLLTIVKNGQKLEYIAFSYLLNIFY